MKKIILLLIASTVWLSSQALALKFPLTNPDQSVVGHLQFYQAKAGDTFAKIARQYGIGYFELVEANPGVDPKKPEVNTALLIPTQYILPNTPHKGMVVNIAEMRLYYFPADGKSVYTFPVGIGKQDWETPLGKMHIIQKREKPTWFVPKSIYEYRKKQGLPAQKVVPPGPNNPLGEYAMRLSQPMYLIHGTNDPAGVGRRSSAGCIRLYPEDIEELYKLTALKTEVNIINNPFKVGIKDNKVLLESHVPLVEQAPLIKKNPDFVKEFIQKALTEQECEINWDESKSISEEYTGIPTAIGIKKQA